MPVTGVEQVIRNLNRQIRDIEDANQRGLTRAALLVRREAMKKVPIVTGNLRASAYTISGTGKTSAGSSPSFKGDEEGEAEQQHDAALAEASGRATTEQGPYAEVGFSAVYAWSVHENPRAGKTGGVSPSGKRYKPKTYSTRPAGQYKFLELALTENEQAIIDIIRREAERGLNR